MTLHLPDRSSASSHARLGHPEELLVVATLLGACGHIPVSDGSFRSIINEGRHLLVPAVEQLHDIQKDCYYAEEFRQACLHHFSNLLSENSLLDLHEVRSSAVASTSRDFGLLLSELHAGGGLHSMRGKSVSNGRDFIRMFIDSVVKDARQRAPEAIETYPREFMALLVADIHGIAATALRLFLAKRGAENVFGSCNVLSSPLAIEVKSLMESVSLELVRRVLTARAELQGAPTDVPSMLTSLPEAGRTANEFRAKSLELFHESRTTVNSFADAHKHIIKSLELLREHHAASAELYASAALMKPLVDGAATHRNTPVRCGALDEELSFSPCDTGVIYVLGNRAASVSLFPGVGLGLLSFHEYNSSRRSTESVGAPPDAIAVDEFTRLSPQPRWLLGSAIWFNRFGENFLAPKLQFSKDLFEGESRNLMSQMVAQVAGELATLWSDYPELDPAYAQGGDLFLVHEEGRRYLLVRGVADAEDLLSAVGAKEWIPNSQAIRFLRVAGFLPCDENWRGIALPEHARDEGPTHGDPDQSSDHDNEREQINVRKLRAYFRHHGFPSYPELRAKLAKHFGVQEKLAAGTGSHGALFRHTEAGRYRATTCQSTRDLSDPLPMRVIVSTLRALRIGLADFHRTLSQ